VGKKGLSPSLYCTEVSSQVPFSWFGAWRQGEKVKQDHSWNRVEAITRIWENQVPGVGWSLWGEYPKP
jgi:hypothetical protein